MTQTANQQYVMPLCPRCGAKLDHVWWTGDSTYVFSSETGRYEEDTTTGEGHASCPSCEHSLGDVKGFEDGPVNFETISIQEWRQNHPVSHYKHCVTCNMTFDLWKYGSIEDAGHEEHQLRDLTPEEYEQATVGCLEECCFKDD